MSTESDRARAGAPDIEPKGKDVKTEASTSTTPTAEGRTDAPEGNRARTVDGTDQAHVTDGDKRAESAAGEGVHASTAGGSDVASGDSKTEGARGTHTGASAASGDGVAETSTGHGKTDRGADSVAAAGTDRAADHSPGAHGTADEKTSATGIHGADGTGSTTAHAGDVKTAPAGIHDTTDSAAAAPGTGTTADSAAAATGTHTTADDTTTAPGAHTAADSTTAATGTHTSADGTATHGAHTATDDAAAAHRSAADTGAHAATDGTGTGTSDRLADKSPTGAGHDHTATESAGTGTGEHAALGGKSAAAGDPARTPQDTHIPGSAEGKGSAPVEQAPGANEVIPPLFDEPTLDQLRTRWREVQGSFVDSPRQAVSRADDLVAELIQQLAAAYTARKQALADKAPGEADTEALRQTLRHYRALFDQLLTPA